MSCSICINERDEIDLTRVELDEVAASLRRHAGRAEATVMRELFWPMEEAGLACILADALDAAEFAVFAEVVRRAHEQALRSASAALALWARLADAVRADTRYAAA